MMNILQVETCMPSSVIQGGKNHTAPMVSEIYSIQNSQLKTQVCSKIALSRKTKTTGETSEISRFFPRTFNEIVLSWTQSHCSMIYLSSYSVLSQKNKAVQHWTSTQCFYSDICTTTETKVRRELAQHDFLFSLAGVECDSAGVICTEYRLP